ASPVEDVPFRSSSVWVVGEETLRFQTRSFQCEIRCPLNEDGTPRTEDRTWVVKGAGYGGGAVLKVDAPGRSVVAKSVWDQTLKIKRREFNCVVVESESKVGEQMISLKAWYSSGVPRPVRAETDEESIALVDFGSEWTDRPPYPSTGSGPKK
ncbi:MAG TPA: hypothetical protein VEN81_00215, partial [Planctomycetota bacterium]|nr:hypothetical protein [Planctomycetota bacterium]